MGKGDSKMAEKPKRTLRLGQLVSTHSVGSIVDIGNESLICKDIGNGQLKDLTIQDIKANLDV